MRCFVALNLSPATRDAVHGAMQPLRDAIGRAVSWVAGPALHVTLRFLGERDTRFVDTLAARLAVVSRALTPISLHLLGVGAFPSVDRPRVLWVGADLNPPLAGLYQSVDDACTALGVAREARGFHPHVTVGRMRDGARVDVAALRRFAAAFPFAAVERIAAVDVMESVLGPRGARHRVVHSISLSEEEND